VSTAPTFDFRLSTLLSLDTATDRPTLALGTPGDPGADVVIPHRHDLSREIDAVTRRLLRERSITPGQLAGVLVGDGPGSFTGLRIGIAFARGLTRALGVPLLVAPSMMGAARAVAGLDPVVVDYDALRGECYRAAWSFAPSGVEQRLAPAIVRTGEPVALGAPVARAGAGHASAAALLRLAGVPGGARPVDSSWEPTYGRPAEAEVRRLATQPAAGR